MVCRRGRPQLHQMNRKLANGNESKNFKHSPCKIGKWVRDTFDIGSRTDWEMLPSNHDLEIVLNESATMCKSVTVSPLPDSMLDFFPIWNTNPLIELLCIFCNDLLLGFCIMIIRLGLSTLDNSVISRLFAADSWLDWMCSFLSRSLARTLCLFCNYKFCHVVGKIQLKTTANTKHCPKYIYMHGLREL